MFIKAYLRASIKKQVAKLAKNELIHLANDHDHKIAAFMLRMNQEQSYYVQS